MQWGHYHTISDFSTYCYEEKKSRFIAQLWPANNKEQTQQYLAQTKLDYPDARHHCWAYVFGNPEQAQAAGFNDAGEPAGTAGKPMLNVLKQRKVGDVFAVVIRYFGGIKLGAGGLTRAYGQAVSGALDLAQLRSVVPMTQLEVIFDYALEAAVRNLLNQFNALDIKVLYDERVILQCIIANHLQNEFKTALLNRCAGNITLPKD